MSPTYLHNSLSSQNLLSSASVKMSVDTVTAELNYFTRPTDGSRPYIHINADPVTGVRAQNWVDVPRQVEIENIRGKEDTVSLDLSGFQFFKEEAKHKSFSNDEEIEREYYPESIELIKRLTGASSAVVFDHSKCKVTLYSSLALISLISRSSSTPRRNRRQPRQAPARSPSPRRSN